MEFPFPFSNLRKKISIKDSIPLDLPKPHEGKHVLLQVVSNHAK